MDKSLAVELRESEIKNLKNNLIKAQARKDNATITSIKSRIEKEKSLLKEIKEAEKNGNYKGTPIVKSIPDGYRALAEQAGAPKGYKTLVTGSFFDGTFKKVLIDLNIYERSKKKK